MQRSRPPGSQFASGDPRLGGRISRWARRYPAPLVLTGVFLAVLAGAAVTSPGESRFTSVVGTPDAAEQQPVRTLCPVCGLGESCDAASGMCVLDEPTPAPCVKGSTYDQEQGFCVPDPTPVPTPYPTKTLEPEATERPASSPSPTPPRSTPSSSSPDPEDPEPTKTPAQQTPAASTPDPADD